MRECFVITLWEPIIFFIQIKVLKLFLNCSCNLCTPRRVHHIISLLKIIFFLPGAINFTAKITCWSLYLSQRFKNYVLETVLLSVKIVMNSQLIAYYQLIQFNCRV